MHARTSTYELSEGIQSIWLKQCNSDKREISHADSQVVATMLDFALANERTLCVVSWSSRKQEATRKMVNSIFDFLVNGQEVQIESENDEMWRSLMLRRATPLKVHV